MNIFDSLERAQIRFPDKDAVMFKGQRTTYGELYEQACRLSAALSKRFGLLRADRVAIFLPNIPEFIVSYYAIEKLGAVAVSLNVMLKRNEVEFILRDCGARVLIAMPQFLEEVPENISSLEAIVTVGATDRPGCWQFAELASERPASAAPGARVESEDGAAILYTSGTTGQPKGVLLTHGNLVSNSQATHHHTRMTAEDRLLCFLPLFHCFGQNFIMNTAVQAGATLLLHERFVPDEILKSAIDNKATMFFGVPAVYIRLLAQPDIEKNLESIRYYFSAAAPITVKTVRSWQERFGQIIYEGYGLTETSPFATYNHDSEYREGSVGTAIQYVTLKIINERGETLPPGELGEIAIKGPNVMKGYFNRPEENARVIHDGWFLSGDIGRMEGDGHLYLVDRAKDMINVSGFKVWPREVEEVLSQHPDLTESAVIGVPHPVSGEAVKAFVVPKKGAQLTEKDVIDFCRDRIAVYKAPRYVEFIDALPRNPSGKVLKRELRLREPERKKVA
ncbi:MAG TPA: long-chain fatty acid--CoA ligase [Candidatus Binatia bacterium]